MVRSGRRENRSLQEVVRLGRCAEESLGIRRRSGSDLEAAGRPVAVRYSFPLAAVAGEEEKVGERGKGETRHKSHNKGADKQETSKTKLRKGTTT